MSLPQKPLHGAAIGFEPSEAFGVYVHVPFCVRRCPYCDFAVVVRREIPHEAYRDAVLAELEARADLYGERRARTLYFGGGTPSLWRPSCLGAVVEAVRERFGEPDEVTLEANPEQITPELLAVLKQIGVTRLSLGVQSFAPAMIEHLGRGHTAKQASAVVGEAVAAGFERLNVDLIFGGPEQELRDHLADLGRAVQLGAGHISVYGLTVEPFTRFGRFAERGRRVVASEGVMEEMFERGGATLAALGLRRYEVSNFALEGHWSRHNVLTWMGGEYLGVGLGAHSLRRTQGGAALRRAAGRDIKAYLRDPLGHLSFQESLSSDTHTGERLFVALRTAFWCDLEGLRRSQGGHSVARYDSALERLEEQGLVHRRGELVASSARGMALHNIVAAEIAEAMPPS